MLKRHATCSCGQLRIPCSGDPVRVSLCHCLACQRRTGSPFGAQARFAQGQVGELEGRSSQWVRIGDSGGRATFHFCPTCGSTVFWTVDRLEGFVVVAVGAFADPAFPAPTVAVYEARRHPWVELPGLALEHFD